ncbi:Na(+)/H(+) antiporter subunit D [Oceanidesulfovibrio indonesiensis]|uniref:Na(+)/H(+) antiporter subunit D n=1 Tax=Oceanidesulfovibrio indonesiensis TaxID=54767 RepID=A0A7M3MBF6_9BACT|nr:Na(+)/H(+) antiporter subunit D [Oceanidesulfovibrio indonesiensis]TVM15517.1 Na(+)/H(+) antiporter subunit D [Oceanidesulfovibrio indonesiensis]
MLNSFFHPAALFIPAALLAPFIPRSIVRWITLVVPVAALAAVYSMDNGAHWEVSYLGLDLTFGRVDQLSIIFAHVFAIQSFLGFLFAFHLKSRLQHIAALLYVGGAFGAVFAGDYLTLFIFWELMSVASTFLVLFNRQNKLAAGAAFRYFLFHTLGGLFLLGGLLLRSQALGTFAFLPTDPAGLQLYDYLIMLGFCVNAAVVPLHAWLPDTYPEATVTGAVFMSAFTTKTAVYVLARGFAGAEVLAVMGTVMAVYGVFYATIENNARRILSYHIVSQVGYMVAGVGIGTAMTVNGACAHAYAHILYKGLLFMGAGCLLYAAGTAKLTELGGLVRRLPLVFIFYMVAALSISGMPFFNGFVSKTMTIAGAANAHHTWLALGLELAAVGTFLSVGLKLPYFAFYAKPENKMPLKKIPANMYIAMALGSFLCILTGLWPSLLYQLLPFQHGLESYSPYVLMTSFDYTPYTLWHILQAFMILGFTGLGFYLMRKVVVPHAQRNLDFEYLYRIVGRAFMMVVTRPAAAIDAVWGEVYRTIGLAFLLITAKLTSIFDRKGIDGVLDGSVYGVGRGGHALARTQTGKLQGYLAAALIIGLLVFAAAWFTG